MSSSVWLIKPCGCIHVIEVLATIGRHAFVLYIITVVVSVFFVSVYTAAGVQTGGMWISNYSRQIPAVPKDLQTVGNASANILLQFQQLSSGLALMSTSLISTTLAFFLAIVAGIPYLLGNLVTALASGSPLYIPLMALAVGLGSFLQVAAWIYMASKIVGYLFR